MLGSIESQNSDIFQELQRIDEAIAHYSYELDTMKSRSQILELKLENIKKLQKEISKLV